MLGRRIYTSSSGDAWDLIREDGTGRLYVKHTPNLASGGLGSHTELGDFLARKSYNAEHVALLELIGSLVEMETAKEERQP